MIIPTTCSPEIAEKFQQGAMECELEFPIDFAYHFRRNPGPGNYSHWGPLPTVTELLVLYPPRQLVGKVNVGSGMEFMGEDEGIWTYKNPDRLYRHPGWFFPDSLAEQFIGVFDIGPGWDALEEIREHWDQIRQIYKPGATN